MATIAASASGISGIALFFTLLIVTTVLSMLFLSTVSLALPVSLSSQNGAAMPVVTMKVYAPDSQLLIG